MKRVPKTVGDLKRILSEYPDDMPILRNRGNMTYEPFNKYTTVVPATVKRLRSTSKVSVEVGRFSDMNLKTQPFDALTIG